MLPERAVGGHRLGGFASRDERGTVRVLLFARQKMEVGDRADIYAVAPRPGVREALLHVDPEQEDINVVESYEPFRDSDRKGKRPD